MRRKKALMSLTLISEIIPSVAAKQSPRSISPIMYCYHLFLASKATVFPIANRDDLSEKEGALACFPSYICGKNQGFLLGIMGGENQEETWEWRMGVLNVQARDGVVKREEKERIEEAAKRNRDGLELKISLYSVG